ncbi:MAG: hypothetical protein HFJ03_03275 [Lachnospira sp.]|jgi:hypothetical protein|nr:hypothetical protein [Lachnospira sp.]
MRKVFILFLTVFFMFAFYACGNDIKTDSKNTNDEQKLKSNSQENSIKEGRQKIGTLEFICNSERDSACNTENGYYYLTRDLTKLQDGNYGNHLMYMDFATCREIYLCSTAGCKHNSLDCPAVFSYDDFPIFTTKLFVYDNYLYILSRESSDESVSSSEGISQNIMGGDDEYIMSQRKPAVLYRANLDGTERKKVYTFDEGLTLEEFILKDENGIYVITKKLSIDKVDNMTYTTGSEHKVVFLDLQSFHAQEVCPISFDNHISWDVIGCYQDCLILSGIDYGRELSMEEKLDDDTYHSLYEDSFDIYAILDLKSGELNEFYRESNKNQHDVYVVGDTMYISFSENPIIEGINIESRERKTICTLEQNLIMNVIDDMLCCRDWNLSSDHTYYFVNMKTGEIMHSMLVNQYNGWDLEFRAETSSDMLVVYDYDATKNSDDSYEIHQYKYALISKEDLFMGKQNYRKIDMIEQG